jgi:chromosomal replication initiation ATPase DnaA
MLITAARRPAGAVRDLGSRFKALPTAVGAARRCAPARRAGEAFADRQIAVDESLIGYVAARIERSFAAARAVVAQLDEEAMRRKRPLTRALAAEILHRDDA